MNLESFERNNLLTIFAEEQLRRGLTPIETQQERPLIEEQLRSTESAIELYRLIREGEPNAANEVRVTIPEASPMEPEPTAMLQPVAADPETPALLREISAKLGQASPGVMVEQTNNFNGEVGAEELTFTSQDLEAAARRAMLGV